MEFFAPGPGIRPVNLSSFTRQFAYESLNHKYGLKTKEHMAVVMDDVEGFSEMSPYDKYDAMIRKIVTEAPVRIVPGELVSGSATLGLAISHVTPATYRGEVVFGSVSHLTADFERVVSEGIVSLEAEASACMAANKDENKAIFYRSVLNTIESFKIYHKRVLSALPSDSIVRKNLERVPYHTPTSFHEAVQSIWFTFSFLRLLGNWPGIGRIDKMLGPFLRKDLASGKITLSEAREILAHFFIKGCEWVDGTSNGSGDAQHYQNLVIGGIDEDGNDVTNEVTYLVLDIIEELGIADFPTTVRISSKTDEKLIRRAAEVIRLGGGAVAIYNEDKILDALDYVGYPLRDARNFANDGCWEVQIPGRTFFRYCPFDGLGVLQHTTLKDYSASFDNFEDIKKQYLSDLDSQVLDGLFKATFNEFNTHPPVFPTTAIALFERGCVRNGYDYYSDGSDYVSLSPHIGGLPDVANSLYAIKKVVFDDKLMTFDEFMRILQNNWEGEEALRLNISRRYTWWGNDNDEVDMLCAELCDGFADLCHKKAFRHPKFKFVPGISTFGRQLEWLPSRIATPFGKRKGDILSGNMSPTPGTDSTGATAIIRSYCKCAMVKQTTGAALDIHLLPTSVTGEDGIDAIMALIRGFVALGGFFMQLDVLDKEILKAAQEHPEDYQTLSVRVSGWNARFVTLNREWQRIIIERDPETI